MMLVAQLGQAVRLSLTDIGAAARLFISLIGRLPRSLMRFGLVRDQVFYLGNRSLSIIGV